MAEGHVRVQDVRVEELKVGQLGAKEAGLQEVDLGHVRDVPHTPGGADRSLSSSTGRLQHLNVCSAFVARMPVVVILHFLHISSMFTFSLHSVSLNYVHVVLRPGVVAIRTEGSPEVAPQSTRSSYHRGHNGTRRQQRVR